MDNLRCTVISGQELKSAKCENYPTSSVSHVSGKRLGDICEARPRDTVDGKGSCHFPFEHEGVTHDSCVPPESEQGAPWCATKVSANGEIEN